jgi:hypothetical protein
MADLSSVAKVILTAEDRTSPAFQSVENAVDGLHSKVTGFISGGLAALGAALSIDSFGQMLHGVIETQAHLQDLADKVGTTVSALSQLAPAAKLSGTAMDDVAAFSAKFSKTLASIVEGNEKATAAFKAFGFSVQDAAKYLDDPIAGLQELAKHFGNAVNDGNRTAAMMELLGKNASNAAPFLKQLAEMGELHTTVTNEQAAAAKRLEDQWTIMQSAGNGLKNTMATMVAEALAPMIEKFNLARAAGLGFGDALASVSRSGEDDSKYISSLRDRIAELSGTVEEARAKAAKNSPYLFVDPAQLRKDEQSLADLEKTYRQVIKARDDLIFANLQGSFYGDANDQRLQNTAASLSKVKIAFQDVRTAVDTFTPAMDAARKSLVDAQIALDDVGKAADEKTTPAMKALKEMQASPVWEGWNATQRAAYTAEMNRVDSLQKVTAALIESNKLQSDLDTLIGQLAPKALGFTDTWTQQFGLLNKAFNAGKLTLEEFQALTAKLLEQQPFEKERQKALDGYIKSLNDAIKLQQKMMDDATQALGNYADQNTLLERQTQLIGLGEIERAKALVVMDAQKDRQKLILAGDMDGLTLLDAEIVKRQNIVGQQIQMNREMEGWKTLWTDVANAGANFITDFVEHGSSAFKNLWSDFKKWALEAIAKIAAQQIVVSIAGNFGPVSGAAANSLFGGNLLGGGGQGGGASGGSGVSNIVSGVSNLFTGGGTLATQASAFTANLGLAADAGLEAVGGFTGLFSSAMGPLMAAVPWLALAAFAVPLIAGLFDDGPANRTASFGSNAGLGAGNPLFQSSSNFGTFGVFNDSWFSDKDQGPAIQQFLAGIAAVDNAIANIVDAPTLERIKANLATATTTFSAGMEHEATTFGSIMKDRYHTVVEAIDPELTHLVDQFQGTGEELGKFVIGIVAVHEVLKTFNNEDLFGQIVTVDDILTLQHAGESVTDTFSRVANEFSLTNAIAAQMGQNVTTAFGEVGLASEAARADLIKLMGGMNNAAAAFQNYLQVAFTDTERQARSAAAATNALNAVFGDLHVSVPQTWAELNAYIDSLDLSTEAGRAAYAEIMTRGVPAFVALHGSAQDAANSVTNQSNANNAVATSAAKVINPMMGVVQAFTQLRSAADIAATHVNALTDQNDTVAGFVGGSDSGTKLSNRLSLITGEIHDLEEQLGRYQGGDLSNVDNAFGEIATLMKSIAPLKTAQNDLADSLAHFATLSAQYGNATANQLYDLEQNYKQARDKVADNATALGILKSSFDTQWASIVGGAKDAVASVADTTASVVEHVITPLETAIAGLHTAFANDSVLTDAVKWLNGIDTKPTAKGDDWQTNLNNALPDGKFVSQADYAAGIRVIGQMLDESRQLLAQIAGASKDTATAVQTAPASRVSA